MSRVLGLLGVFVVGFGVTGVAWGVDCVNDFSGADCEVTVGANTYDVCTYSAGDDEITCTGTGNVEVYILAVYGSNPLIYGTHDQNQSFCCDNTGNSDWSITAAVDVDIDTAGSSDIICLTDWSISDCLNTITGVQYWDAAATIDAGAVDDTVVTCTDGDFADYVVAGNGHDEVHTFDGDDTIYGYDGTDDIRAGEGDDWVDAGPGDDFVRGDTGADTLLGETAQTR